MFDRDQTEPPENPVDDRSRVPVAGADGWFYLPFERDEETKEHRIKLVREDGEEVQMTLPSFVEQGDELGEIALLVIRARERWRDLKGLGG
ncbi:MAG: hypothetical protein M3025_02860 [Actinomycetota bacterium]|nr:hypothetical protein [Actinomycetota bacterium]